MDSEAASRFLVCLRELSQPNLKSQGSEECERGSLLFSNEKDELNDATIVAMSVAGWAKRVAHVHVPSACQVSASHRTPTIATHSKSASTQNMAMNADDRGQELRVRRQLVDSEGWKQPSGITSDEDVAVYLGIQGKRADLLMYKPAEAAAQRQWLVGESKGGNLDDAYYQLQAVAEALWNKKDAGATAVNTELRIYMSPGQYARVLEAPSGRGGYYIQDGFLAAVNEQTGQIEPLTGIGGLKIQVMPSGSPPPTGLEVTP